MSKETKDRDIVAEIEGNQVLTQSKVDAAAAKIQAKIDKKQEKEIIQVTLQSRYDEGAKLLDLRQNREKEEVIKVALKSRNELAEKVKGKEPITMPIYKKELEEISNTERKAIREIENKYYELERNLRAQTTGLRYEFDDDDDNW